MFSGSFDHVLDDKGRTSLPKDFRDLLAGQRAEPWLTCLPDCLAIYPESEYEALRGALSTASKVNGSVSRLLRLITGMASRCPFDKQGRILIPPKLRAWAALQRDIVFTGVGNRIEIWDRARHQAELERIRDNFDDYTKDLKDFGL